MERQAFVTFYAKEKCKRQMIMVNIITLANLRIPSSGCRAIGEILRRSVVQVFVQRRS